MQNNIKKQIIWNKYYKFNDNLLMIFLNINKFYLKY